MDYLLAIIAGAIQGITEFLPVSSSGHLIIFHDIFKFNLPDNLAFDAVLHLGTAAALIIFFWPEIIKLLKAFFLSLTNWNLKNDLYQRLAWLIILGSIPAIIVGGLFNDLIDTYFHQGDLAVMVVAGALIIVAGLFWLVEKYAFKLQTIDDMTWGKSLWCGVAQAIALIPGVSRSGITIVAGMMAKMKREEAAKFSFLLSIPIVLGAGLKSLISIGDAGEINLLLLFVGFLSASGFGYLTVKYFLKYLGQHSLSVFAWYRVILAVALISWVLFY